MSKKSPKSLSPADVRATANKYGISIADAVKKLSK